MHLFRFTHDKPTRPMPSFSSSSSSSAAISRSTSSLSVDAKINNIIGKGISGILYKWVNYGRGWRPRWFVLKDGVLSYHKIDKIVFDDGGDAGTVNGLTVIGEESLQFVSRHRSNRHQHRGKASGEIHLKVSSICQSGSDKRFSIFTGTKKLHLRAETSEDCTAWLEALQAVKDIYPRLSNTELMASPMDDLNGPTDKLRQLLTSEGVSEAAIHDSEQIMRSEFAALENQLLLLKQKQCLLEHTLKDLEGRDRNKGSFRSSISSAISSISV